MPDSIRAFIAIELPASLIQKLKQIAQPLKPVSGKAVRWVDEKNIHLTLKFLGDVPTRQIPALTRALDEQSAAFSPFRLRVAGLGAFPNTRRPRVVWVGVEMPPVLAQLQLAVDRGTQSLGFPGEDRPFSPHLTLGRISQSAQPAELARFSTELSAYAPTVGELAWVDVSGITLFRSDLRPTGPIYTVLHHTPLTAPPSSNS